MIIGNLWRPISWEPRALTKQITMPHTHTSTNTPKKNKHSSHGFDGNKKESEKSVGRREEMGFQFWLETGEWCGMPNRERERVPDDRSNILKGSLLKSPAHLISHTSCQNTEFDLPGNFCVQGESYQIWLMSPLLCPLLYICTGNVCQVLSTPSHLFIYF